MSPNSRLLRAERVKVNGSASVACHFIPGSNVGFRRNISTETVGLSECSSTTGPRHKITFTHMQGLNINRWKFNPNLFLEPPSRGCHMRARFQPSTIGPSRVGVEFLTTDHVGQMWRHSGRPSGMNRTRPEWCATKCRVGDPEFTEVKLK
jgi:hypothetical protein